MRKLRSDALWHKLTPEQQKKIEHWFFVENLGLQIVHERMQKELGIRCARSILGPMYQRLNELRSTQREAVLDMLTEILVDSGTSFERVRTGALTVVTSHLLTRAAENGNTKDVAALGRVMLQGELRDIQRSRAKLAGDKLELTRRLAPEGAFQQQQNNPSISETDTPTVSPGCNSLHLDRDIPG